MNNAVVTFDTLEYANELKAGGVPEKQAEAQAKALAKITSNTLATKQDLKDLENRILYKLGGYITLGFTVLGFILHK